MLKFESERVLYKEIIKNFSEDKILDLAVIGDTLIVVSESKLRLCLTNHVHNIGKKDSWIIPLSLCSGFLIALVTCDFKEIIFSKDMWKASFFIICIICLFWFIITLKYIFQPITIDDIITELKKDRIKMKNRR